MALPDFSVQREIVATKANNLFAQTVHGLANFKNALSPSSDPLLNIMVPIDFVLAGAAAGTIAALGKNIIQRYRHYGNMDYLQRVRYDQAQTDHFIRETAIGGTIGGGLGLVTYGIVTALQSGIIH